MIHVYCLAVEAGFYSGLDNRVFAYRSSDLGSITVCGMLKCVIICLDPVTATHMQTCLELTPHG